MTSLSSAQTHLRATAATGFFKDPNGVRLGTLVQGISYRVGRPSGTWMATTVEGYIWSASTERTTRDGFDLVVTASGGEVMRESPNGTVVARLVEGTLLARVATRGAWIQVRREGSATRSAFGEGAQAVTTPPPAPVPPPEPTASNDTTATPDSLAAAVADPVPPAVASSSERVTLRKGTELATAPDGARVAVLADGGEAAVLERSNGWARIQVDVWVRESDITGSADPGPRITGAMVHAEPDRYVGQTVTWRLHFLSLEEADDLRPEMPAGQPYLLTRGPLPESGFVYVMVGREQLAAARSLRPLDTIRIEGIIRSGRTRYLPTPVVEMTRLVDR